MSSDSPTYFSFAPSKYPQLTYDDGKTKIGFKIISNLTRKDASEVCPYIDQQPDTYLIALSDCGHGGQFLCYDHDTITMSMDSTVFGCIEISVPADEARVNSLKEAIRQWDEYDQSKEVPTEPTPILPDNEVLVQS